MSNEQNIDLTGVMRRIEKLLAIAGDARANPAEASAAAAMAERIMRKHQLEHADIVRAELQRKENFDTNDQCVVMKKGQGHRPTKVPVWAQWLATKVAKMHDCEVRLAYNSELGACVRFFGFKSDVQVCGWTFDYLTTQVIRNVRAFQKEERRDKTESESESYRRGFVMRLLTMIDSSLAAKDKEVASASNSRELMVVKQQALAERYGDFKYKSAKNTRVSDQSAFSRGVRDGSAVDVARRAVGHESETRLALNHH